MLRPFLHRQEGPLLTEMIGRNIGRGDREKTKGEIFEGRSVLRLSIHSPVLSSISDISTIPNGLVLRIKFL